jgi:hypothetical protein
MRAPFVSFELKSTEDQKTYCALNIFHGRAAPWPRDPKRYVVDTSGYQAVIANGEVLLEDGAHTDARPGHCAARRRRRTSLNLPHEPEPTDP